MKEPKLSDRCGRTVFGALVVVFCAMGSTTFAQSNSIVTVSVPLDVTQAHTANLMIVDVPFPEPVPLMGLRYAIVEGWEIHGTRTPVAGVGWECTISAQLEDSDGQMVLWMLGSGVSNGTDSLDLSARCWRVISGNPLASTEEAAGIELRLFYPAGPGAPYDTTFTGMHTNNEIRVHFVYGPSGLHSEFEFDAEHPLFGGNVTPWQTVDLATPIPARGLRLVTTEVFEFVAASPAEFSTHVQILFDDGSWVSLDDHNAPSTLGVSETVNFTHSIRLDDATLESLLDRMIVGFRWRFQLGPNTSAALIDLHTNRVRFFFDVALPLQDCNGNGVPDQYDVDLDVDGDGYPDDCELFVRGLCNGDLTFDLGDAVFSLSSLFGVGPQPTCQDACDMNDDGLFTIADPIAALNALFGTDTLPMPMVSCGQDPTLDALDCAEFFCP